jgi:hypothetical protein
VVCWQACNKRKVLIENLTFILCCRAFVLLVEIVEKLFAEFLKSWLVDHSSSVASDKYSLLCADVFGTCLALSLLTLHASRRLYQSMRVSIFSRHRTAGVISLLNGWVFHIAAGLSVIAESPAFVRQEFGEYQL